MKGIEGRVILKVEGANSREREVKGRQGGRAQVRPALRLF